MGKFDKFKGKGNSQVNTTLKVNKYENKDVVLDLISYISTAEAENSSEVYFTPLLAKLDEFESRQASEHPDYRWIKNHSGSLSYKLWDFLSDVVRSLNDSYGKPTLKVAVAGGYSAGKSTFLNYLIGDADLLPTGVEPVSIVNTHLTTVPGNTNIVIRGRNLRDGFVPLDKGVLQIIKHSSKSSVHVASVLKCLYIDCPVKDRRLANVTFVDTPGYNNSLGSNVENATTDRSTALKQLKNVDAIVWCIDIEKGIIPKDDLRFLQEVQKQDDEKPILVVLTKRHKKKVIGNNLASDRVQKDIILKVTQELKKGLSQPSKLFGVCAFSIDEPVPFLSYDNRDFYSFIDNCKNLRGVKDYCEFVKQEVARIIMSAQNEVADILKELEQERKELTKSKSDSYSELEKEKRSNRGFIDMVRHYMETSRNYDFTQEQKKWMLEEIVNKFNWRYDILQDNYNDLKDEYSNVLRSIHELHSYSEALKRFRKDIVFLFELSYESYIKHLRPGMVKSASETCGFDVFSAIAAGNMSRFTDCLSNGITLNTCNAQGYNPLTYCVVHGRMDMLKYMLDNGAPADITDNRGFTPFETAVIVHSKAFCELLLSYDKDLKRTRTPLGELVKKNTFENWVRNL